MRRLIGLLMILTLLLPPLLGAGALFVAADAVGRGQAAVSARVAAITDRLSQTETTINAVSAQFGALKSVADQVSAAARAAAQAVAAADFTIRYGGATASPGTNGANVPAAALGAPGMSSVRRFLQNLYDTLGSLASAISDVTAINQVPGQFGLAVGEAQGLAADLNALSATYGLPLLCLGIGFALWLLMIYVVIMYRWLKPAWGMLTGRAA